MNNLVKKYSEAEKIKYLNDAIKDGGYYGSDGTWNSIAKFDNDKNIYRVRVETLIIRDDNYIFLKMLPKNNVNHKRYKYLIPGGSIAKDISNIDQAINECREEARINIRNIQSTGITYKQLAPPPKWAIDTQPVNWDGNFTEVYVAEYDSKFTGYIDKVDVDKFIESGRFYPLDKIYGFLRKEHRDALKVIYPKRFKNRMMTESANTKEKLLEEALTILRNNGYNPRVSEASKKAFLNNGKHIVSDSTSLCISGFKNKEVISASRLLNSKMKDKYVRFSPDNYGTIFLTLVNGYVIEKALTTKERNKLDDSQFGIPSLRKFPLHDTNHVIQAIREFNRVDREYEKELANNIKKAMKSYGIDFSIVGNNNRLKSYL